MNGQERNEPDVPPEMGEAFSRLAGRLAGEQYPGRAWPAGRTRRRHWPIAAACAAAALLALGLWAARTHSTGPAVTQAPAERTAEGGCATRPVGIEAPAMPLPVTLDPCLSGDLPQDGQMLAMMMSADLKIPPAGTCETSSGPSR